MKVHVKRSEAESLLVAIGYAWDAGVFAPTGKDVEVVKRMFQNWPDLRDKWGWVLVAAEKRLP